MDPSEVSFTLNRLRNENRQLRSLIRDIEFDLDEERALRKKLELKLEKLAYGPEYKPMAKKKVRDVLDKIFDEKNSSEIMTFGKCQYGRDSESEQELVELRANIQIIESQFLKMQAEVTREMDLMSEERNLLLKKIEDLETANAELAAGNLSDGYLKEHNFALAERAKHLAQIESLRCIISSFLTFSSDQDLIQQVPKFDLESNKKLNDAFDELLASETEYISDLNVINDVFREPMEHLDKDVISKSGKSRIFTTLMNIREQHIQLYDILKKAIADKSKIGLGQYFFNIYDLISKYESYSQYFETALTIIHETLKIKLFSRFLITAESNPRCKGKTFMSLLLLPLQRILDYIKLLETICLNLPANHPELSILDQTRLLFMHVVPSLEENKRNAEAYIKTIELKSKISNLPQGFVVPKRRYVCDETLSIVTFDKKVSLRRFFLFSDIMVETKASSSSSKPFRMMMTMFLNDAQVEDIPDDYYIICPNPAVKFEWMQRLTETIDNLKASETSIRVSQSMTGPLHMSNPPVSYHPAPAKGDIPHCTIKLNRVGGEPAAPGGGVEGLVLAKKPIPPNPMVDSRRDDSDMLSLKSYNSYSGYEEEDRMSIKSTKSGKLSSSHHKHTKKIVKK